MKLVMNLVTCALVFGSAIAAIANGPPRRYRTVATCASGERCLPFRSCPALQGALYLSIQGRRQIQSRICGYDHSYALVCCEVTNPEMLRARLQGTTVASASSSPEDLLPKACGHSFAFDKIYGGTVAALGEFPWMVALGYTGESGITPVWGCGGSLISQRYVLTAAHCVTSAYTNNLNLTVVRVGENNLETTRDCVGFREGRRCARPVQDFSSFEVIRHPNFGRNESFSDDIALIRLEKLVELNPFVQPICLPARGTTVAGILGNRNATVIGFGDTESGRRSLELLKVSLPLVDISLCRKVANYAATLAMGPGQICLGGQFQKDSCSKDSGGPAQVSMYPQGPPFVQVGVVSFGTEQCGVDTIPGVYTDVTVYRDWMLSNMRP